MHTFNRLLGRQASHTVQRGNVKRNGMTYNQYKYFGHRPGNQREFDEKITHNLKSYAQHVKNQETAQKDEVEPSDEQPTKADIPQKTEPKLALFAGKRLIISNYRNSKSKEGDII